MAEDFQIAVLNVAAIFAEMNRDAVGTAEFGGGCGPNGIGLVGAPGLAKRGNVVDVDAEFHVRIWVRGEVSE